MDSPNLSPKTPNDDCSSINKAINKNLLTPCRRVGLRRKVLKVCDNLNSEAENIVSPENVSSNISKSSSILNNELISTNCKESGSVIDSTINKSVIKHNSVLSSDNFKADLHNNSKRKRSLRCNENNLNNITENVSMDDLKELSGTIKRKKDHLKRVKRIKTHSKKKEEINKLEELTLEWKRGCQEALIELHSTMKDNGKDITLALLISNFQLPYSVIGYNEDTEEFEH